MSSRLGLGTRPLSLGSEPSSVRNLFRPAFPTPHKTPGLEVNLPSLFLCFQASLLLCRLLLKFSAHPSPILLFPRQVIV